MPERPWKDEYTLLCERCGYVIEGLETSGNCPECGKPIAESLPERRVGTPWQQSPGVGSLVRTWWMTLRHPLRTLDVMRVGGVHAERVMGWLTCFIASILLGLGFVLPAVYMRDPLEAFFRELSRPYPYWKALLALPMFAVIPLITLPLLTWIETRGLIIIGKTKGFRIDKRLARTITAHGCVGWLLMAVLYLVLMNAGSMLIQLNREMPESGARSGGTSRVMLEYVGLFEGDAPRWMYLLRQALWASGLVAGFLFFETFAWFGLRRCKFANRIRPDSPQQGATTRREAAQ